MKNLVNIDDQVKINMPGTVGDEAIVEVNSMQKWPDGVVHYIGKYHKECPNGGEGYDDSVQFVDGEYIVLPKESNLATTISLANSDKLINLINDITYKLNELKTFQIEIKTEK
ncbi:hypothetical protein [Clostridium sp. FP1]|uniref:hypothetical protein n=1 Tax=Clostridium sp. FP1 TaxID=2724076 RepID=UPI0013E97935|nr:hypothetical protein [Clostridium sp. FP1]MBZ9635572.1 hypothetical protein [Clostridium sp. FP1]